jgi:hypothetical protein
MQHMRAMFPDCAKEGSNGRATRDFEAFRDVDCVLHEEKMAAAGGIFIQTDKRLPGRNAVRKLLTC